MDYSIQLYSVRDTMPTDFEGTLRKIADIGYKYVEFAGFFGKSAAEVKSMLDCYGLKVSGTHTGWKEVADNFTETVKYHQKIGNKNIIVPGFDYSTEEKLDDFIDFCNLYCPLLEREGITLGYHNHSGEFIRTAYGRLVHDEIRTRTDVELEIDTYWAFNAKVDPVALMDKYKDRIRVIHIKDGLEDGKGKPLGMGIAPVDAVYKKAKENNVLMCVESETLSPDGLTEAKTCFDYLKKLEKSI